MNNNMNNYQNNNSNNNMNNYQNNNSNNNTGNYQYNSTNNNMSNYQTNSMNSNVYNNLNNDMKYNSNYNFNENVNKSKSTNNLLEYIKSNKKNIGIIIVVIIIVLLLFNIFGKNGGLNKSSLNGYTANVNETLKVNEPVYKFDLTILSLPTKVDNQKVKLKLSIKNLCKDALEFNQFLLVPSLTDLEKNEILNLSMDNYGSKGSLSNSISSGQTAEVEVYFDYLDVNTYEYKTINENLLNSITYLKISVLSDANKSSTGTTNLHFEDYYLKLK